jgi:acyl-CoA thioesterase
MTTDTVRALFDQDGFARHLGIEMHEIAPGYAKASMRLGPSHLNAFGIPHAGALFALADTAFGAAVNAMGRQALAVNVNGSFISAARGGLLTAEAREVSTGAKLASYAMEVRDEDGEVLATFQGLAYLRREDVEALARSLAEDGE